MQSFTWKSQSIRGMLAAISTQIKNVAAISPHDYVFSRSWKTGRGKKNSGYSVRTREQFTREKQNIILTSIPPLDVFLQQDSIETSSNDLPHISQLSIHLRQGALPHTLTHNNFWFPHSNPQQGSDTKLEKPRRKLVEHKGSLRQIGGEIINSVVLTNDSYIYRKIIS